MVKEKSSAESRIKNAFRQLEKVVKATTGKVLHLEEEITNIMENSNTTDVKKLFKDTHL